MHHSLRLYSAHRKGFIRFYMFMAKWTKIPLIINLCDNYRYRRLLFVLKSIFYNVGDLTQEFCDEGRNI